MEKDVTIRCRKSDSELVKKARDEASTEFQENAGFDIKLEVVEDLPEESCVGLARVFPVLVRTLRLPLHSS